MLTPSERTRYSRQLLLPQVGTDGQHTLKHSAVLCVGAGGLGSPVLLYLAAAGVGRIGVVDADQVEVSNLHRQVVHSTAQVGSSKVSSAAERLAGINPAITVEPYPQRLTRHNALDLLGRYDLVVDGSDNFPTRYLVNDACVLLGKPLVYGAIERFTGQASVFNYQGGPNYRDLYPSPPAPGRVPSCAEAGVLGVLPGVIGCIQATEAIKILLGLGNTLSGRLLVYEALTMCFREYDLYHDPGAQPITQLTDYPLGCGSTRSHPHSESNPMSFESIRVEQFKSRLDEGWKPYILDVRSANEAAIVSLSQVDKLHPHDQVLDILDELPRDRDIVVHCKAGGRSAMACKALAEAGLTRLYNLEGGITAWAKRIDPSLPTY